MESLCCREVQIPNPQSSAVPKPCLNRTAFTHCPAQSDCHSSSLYGYIHGYILSNVAQRCRAHPQYFHKMTLSPCSLKRGWKGSFDPNNSLILWLRFYAAHKACRWIGNTYPYERSWRRAFARQKAEKLNYFVSQYLLCSHSLSGIWGAVEKLQLLQRNKRRRRRMRRRRKGSSTAAALFQCSFGHLPFGQVIQPPHAVVITLHSLVFLCYLVMTWWQNQQHNSNPSVGVSVAEMSPETKFTNPSHFLGISCKVCIQIQAHLDPRAWIHF